MNILSKHKLLLRAFSLVHSLRLGPSLQHSIKACRGQHPRTPSIFKYRGFALILIHSYLITLDITQLHINSFSRGLKFPKLHSVLKVSQVLYEQLHTLPSQLKSPYSSISPLPTSYILFILMYFLSSKNHKSCLKATLTQLGHSSNHKCRT